MNDKLNKALSDAYDYIVNVLERQERWLEPNDLYAGYESMHFKPILCKHIFFGLIIEIQKIQLTLADKNLNKLESGQ